MGNTDLLFKTIRGLVESRKFASLRELIVTQPAADLAFILEQLPMEDSALLFRMLPKELAADTFVDMNPDLQEQLIRAFTDTELKEIMEELYTDDAADLCGEMPANIVKRILTQADPQKRQQINAILKYPEDSAGGLMTTEFVDFSPDDTVASAIDLIRRTGIDKETVNICYVTDAGKKLLGVVPIRALILAKGDMKIADIMTPHVLSVTTLEDQENVADLLSKYDLIALPVVDAEDRLVGIITIDDAIDVMQEETSEDIAKMAAVTPTDKPYLKQSVFSIYKSRIPWLMILMVSAAVTGSIITHFEDALSSYIVLAASIPMLMDTGGNCGSQSSVTIIRGISLHEIAFKDILKVMWKEARVSLLCGISLAIVNFGKLMLFNHTTAAVAAVICITMIATIFAAKLVGCSLPILAKKIGLDPAVMASPFITTIVDALSLIIYFNVASAILGL